MHTQTITLKSLSLSRSKHGICITVHSVKHHYASVICDHLSESEGVKRNFLAGGAETITKTIRSHIFIHDEGASRAGALNNIQRKRPEHK